MSKRDIDALIEQDKEKAKKEVINAGLGWWLPEKSATLIKNDNNHYVPDRDQLNENPRLAEEYFVYMQPIRLTVNDKSEYEQESLLMEFVDLQTGEIRETPLRGNLIYQLAKEEVLDMETDQLIKVLRDDPESFDFSGMIRVRYVGKMYDDEKKRHYHTFTAKLLAEDLNK